MAADTEDRTLKLSFDREQCLRCGGEGRINAFGHVHGGVCFKCNGLGTVLTPAGRSAHKLYLELLDAASPRVQAWEVAVGDRIQPQPGKYATVLTKDFSSNSGSVVDGKCLGSAMLGTKKTVHMYTPDAEVKLAPTTEQFVHIIAEVKRRRKGAH